MDSGGAELQQTLLARALVRAGWSVSMAVLDLGQQEGAQWDGVMTFGTYRPDEGIPIVRFLHPRWSKIWQALRRANADVYYTSTAGMHLGLLALFCQRYRKRFVYRSSHDNDFEPDKLRRRVPYLRDRLLFQYGLRRAKTVLVQSRKQADLLRQNFGLNSELTRPFVDDREHTNSGWDEKDIDVLWVSNIRQFKRPDLAVELAERLSDYRVHIVGGPVKNHEALYQEIVRRSDALPSAVFHGKVPYTKTKSLFNRSKLFVNTSDQEGFPNTFLQSWLSGAPVLTLFDPDSIVAREGLGVSGSSIDELEREARDILENQERWGILSKHCAEFVHDRYGEGTVLSPYVRALI